MRPLLILISFLINLVSSYGQGYILLKDNQRIKYDKFRTQKESLLVDIYGKKGKQHIDISKIKGYYLQDEEVLYYLKPSRDSLNYQFIGRELCGRMNLYSKTVETSIAYGSSSTSTYYYIEKSNKFENVLSTNTIGQNKKKKIEILKSFVDDNLEVLNLITEDFNLNSENLISIIKKYNQMTYEYQPIKDTTTLAKLIIYRRGKNKINEQIKIAVNDENFFLNTNDFLTIKIAPNEVTNICFGNAEQLCELVEGNPHFKIYYELTLDKNSTYLLVKKTKKEGDFYLKAINYYKERDSKK